MESSSLFPMPPRAFDGSSRTVEAGASFEWLRQGWAMFMADPGIWLACAVLFLVIMLALSIVPVIGQLAAHLLFPVFGAGLMYLCRRQSEGETPVVADLFIGFRQNTSNLVLVGVIYSLAIFGIAVLVALVVGGGMAAGGMMTGTAIGFGMLFGSVLLGALLIAVLITPVIMAVWFAPPLVFFNAMAPAAAMKASFNACLKNWLPFSIYGVILLVLFFFAALLLGLGFLVLIPVLSGALYASYRDIFVAV